MSSARPAAFRLTRIAATGERFADFAPYVAAARDDGLVAFQAALQGGGAGIFAGDGGPVATLLDTTDGTFDGFVSHADLNAAGDACCYASLARGGQAVVLIRAGRAITVADTRGRFRAIGPLGPTMNDAGAVAFRADLQSGERGIFVGRAEAAAEVVADTGGVFEAFHGLPVLTRGGTVIFRADRKDGGRSVCAAGGGSVATVVGTGERFRELGEFPGANDQGVVAFRAARVSGGEGVFTVAEGRIAAIADTSAGFESFRGAWVNNAGATIFCATPAGGALGLFHGPDPARDRILSVGDPLFDSTVAEFAVNPVSLDDRGRVAVRVRLADQRQLILRADPVR